MYCAIVRASYLASSLPSGTGDANLAVVEIDAVVGVDRAHVVGLVNVDVAGDQIDVSRVLQHDVVEDLQRELGELDGLAAAGFDLLALLFVDAAADSAGQAPVGMHGPAADHLDQGVPVVSHFQHFAGDVHADLRTTPRMLRCGGRGVGTDDEVRPAQGVEMRGVIGGVEDAI